MSLVVSGGSVYLTAGSNQGSKLLTNGIKGTAPTNQPTSRNRIPKKVVNVLQRAAKYIANVLSSTNTFSRLNVYKNLMSVAINLIKGNLVKQPISGEIQFVPGGNMMTRLIGVLNMFIFMLTLPFDVIVGLFIDAKSLTKKVAKYLLKFGKWKARAVIRWLTSFVNAFWVEEEGWLCSLPYAKTDDIATRKSSCRKVTRRNTLLNEKLFVNRQKCMESCHDD